MKTLPRFCRSLFAVVLTALAVSGGGCELVIGPHERTFDPTYSGGAGGGGGGAACAPASTKPCYTGPVGTEGVGTCKGGKLTCKADGSGYGACEGETTPQIETCGGKADTNCDGFLCGATEWAKAFGVTNAATIPAATDGAGNVYVAGFFSGPMKISGTTLVGFGGKDIFVAKFAPKGDLLWADQFGDTGDDVAQAIAVDAAGDVVVTGSITAPVDFGGGAIGGQTYVLKLDASGNHVWSTSCGGAQPAMSLGGGTGIAIDNKGDVVVVGMFGGTANCGDAPHPSAGGLDIFIAKLSGPEGHAVWSGAFGDPADQQVSAVATDGGGNIFIVGPEKGSVNFGGMPLVGAGFYVARFSPSGAHTWSRQWGPAKSAALLEIVADASGALAVAGAYASAGLDLGSGAFPAPPQFGLGAFVAKFDGSGNQLWSKGFAPAVASGVVLDASGGVAIVGQATGSVDVGGGPLQNFQGFVARFDGVGGYVWSRAFSGLSPNDFATPMAIAAGPAGEMAVAGLLDGSVDFGTGSLTTQDPGSSSYFLLKLAPP
jgi:hypothetical protein